MLTSAWWRRLVMLATTVPFLATGLAACGAEPDPDRVARIVIGEPGRLVPTDLAQPDGAQVLSALFSPLVEFDAQGRPEAAAAASITPDRDGRVWTITLREGYTFHNGEPVTADRYLDAWNYGAYGPNQQHHNYYFRRIEGYEALNPRGAGRPAARTLSGLAKVDDHSFRVTLSEPFVEFPAMLGAPAFYPLPEAAFGDGGAVRDEFALAPIGNGPFQMAEGQQDGRITVTRYEEFAGEPPRSGGVEFVVYPEPADAYDDLLAGSVDVVTDIPPARMSTVESDLGDRYRQLPSSAFQFLAFPTYQPELADPEVRRAISMAIDRDEIVKGIFRGTRLPARSFVPPVVPGARAGTCGAACRFDPAAARELYARADGPDKLTITYNADGEHRDWVAATCDQLAANLGVECVASAVPRLADLLAKVEQEQGVGVLRQGWAMDYPSMENYLGPLFTSDGAANVYGYRNPRFDALVDAAAAAESREVAHATYRRAEQILARDLPVIPLRFGTHTIGHSERVRGVTVTRLGQLDVTRLQVLD